ncbi:hypothetical protein [Elizabethkingia anophelis]|uniref:hypothetical protein n=1 Tax=Elizabethkingia anophelis TaxID=1117645 RepID=UPI00136F34B1|nr:hypothetical protein [Elizabethkingia anophelis]MCT4142359.1 hypothetical protein [Elizabethkingia anophelis]MCT4277965.1 hypothetical protein [Elizabethkingia anophelis]MCT4281379.1 hypothetical protein [Elizabethkingia anophelis]MYY44169.1 hypothetical protein [Elizabethkingia anophelis]
MHIDQIRNIIADKIRDNADIWNNVISNTNPGNYGCDEWEVEIDLNDIFVNIPKEIFTINNGYFRADLVLGSSNGDSSFSQDYSKSFTGNGKFEFNGGHDINIKEIDIDIDPDIY